MSEQEKFDLAQLLGVLGLLGDSNAHIRHSFDKLNHLHGGKNLVTARGWNNWIKSLQDIVQQ